MPSNSTTQWECPECCQENGAHTERCNLRHRQTPPAAPVVHLNGTSYKDLYRQMEEASHAIAAAIAAVCGAAPNGRDYYVQSPAAINTAQEEHYARLGKLLAVKSELDFIWMKVSEQERR